MRQLNLSPLPSWNLSSDLPRRELSVVGRGSIAGSYPRTSRLKPPGRERTAGARRAEP
jgi:hypothetical protein